MAKQCECAGPSALVTVVLPIAVLLCILAFAMKMFSGDPDQVPTETKSDDQVIADTLIGMNLNGKAALIEFAKIGCELSEEGLREMIRWDKEATFEGLSFGRVEANTNAAKFDAYFAKEENKTNFQVVKDPGNVIAKSFWATTYPCFILADKFGNIRYRGRRPAEEKLSSWLTTMASETVNPGEALFDVVKLDGEELLAQTKLPDLQDKIVALDTYMGNKGIVVVFTTMFCPFASKAAEEFNQIDSVLKGHDINCVLINLDDSKEEVVGRFAKLKIENFMYDQTMDTFGQWHMHSMPTAIYINAQKEVVYNGNGDWGKLANAIEKHLGLGKDTIIFTAQGTQFG